jgi:hypothetical protein
MYKQLCVLVVLAIFILSSGCMTAAPSPKSTIESTTGSLELSSTPHGAEIYLNGVYRGTTPSTIPDLPNGTYSLELRLHEYSPWTKHVDVQAGTKLYVDVPLEPIATPTTIPTPAPTAIPTPVPTPVPRTILGCFKWETYGWTGTGESFNVTEIFWFQPAGVGLINGTFIYPPPRKPEVSLTGFTWSRDPATQLITVTMVGGSGAPAEVYYNGNNDTITFSNSNMRPTIFTRVPC